MNQKKQTECKELFEFRIHMLLQETGCRDWMSCAVRVPKLGAQRACAGFCAFAMERIHPPTGLSNIVQLMFNSDPLMNKKSSVGNWFLWGVETARANLGDVLFANMKRSLAR